MGYRVYLPTGKQGAGEWELVDTSVTPVRSAEQIQQDNLKFVEMMSRVFDVQPEVVVQSMELREKTSTGSASAESGFIPEGAIGKTVGLSYEPEAK